MTDGAGAYAGPVYFRSWDDLMSGQTGVPVSEYSDWFERQARCRRQDDQTRRLAGVLERGGVPVFREGDGFALVGLVTGCFKPAELQYRRVHFLPSVAAALRAEIAMALDLYLQGLGGDARYAVFTTGRRCRVWDVRKRVIWLNRMVSRWHHEICVPLGIDVLFRAVELPCDDGLTFHVHANVIYLPTRYIQPRKWRRFLRQTRGFFGAHWKDNGSLESVREAVKYVMKGDDLERMLADAPWVIVPLYHQLKGLHLVQGLGGFREFRREIKDGGWKIVPICEGGARRLVRVKRPKRPERDPEAPTGLPRTNQVLSVDLPRAAFCPLKEPVMRISNLDMETLWSDPELLQRARGALADWYMNGAPVPHLVAPQGRSPFTVHTYTTTVGVGGSRDRVPAVETGRGNPHAQRAPP